MLCLVTGAINLPNLKPTLFISLPLEWLVLGMQWARQWQLFKPKHIAYMHDE